MNQPTLTIKRRRLPHWTFPGSTYFVTYRLLSEPLNEKEITTVLKRLKAGDKKFYALIAATVMPDHVHKILTPNEGVSVSQIMKGFKGSTSRELIVNRRTRVKNWQHEYWDRIIRNED